MIVLFKLLIGATLHSGSAAEEIHYLLDLHPGEVSIDYEMDNALIAWVDTITIWPNGSDGLPDTLYTDVGMYVFTPEEPPTPEIDWRYQVQSHSIGSPGLFLVKVDAGATPAIISEEYEEMPAVLELDLDEPRFGHPILHIYIITHEHFTHYYEQIDQLARMDHDRPDW